MNIIDAIIGRQAVRAFVDRPVDDTLIAQILDTARWSPSGVNTQPWFVEVARGKTLARITDSIIEYCEAGGPPQPDYAYYPDNWESPYKDRRKACGLSLYSALDIGREDKEQQKQAKYNNYRFFNAPVELFIFIDRQMNQGSWLDLGMFVQSIMLAAREFGLETCPQASVADYPQLIRAELGVDDSRLLACGIALGYADPTAAVNQYRLERETVESFTRWHD